MGNGLDKRLNAFRGDLADSRLRGKVEAEQFVDGTSAQIGTHFADMRSVPNEDAGLDAQILFGQTATVFERNNGWAWVQNDDNGYVGYVQEATLCERGTEPTHIISAPRTFLYIKSDLKSPRNGYLSMGSKIVVVDNATERGTDYLILESGQAMIAKHAIKVGAWKSDPVSVAETLLHTPYLWGGNTGFGIDCSGLICLANQLCGKTLLRDSDMQARSVGEELPFDMASVQRGDFIFWKGHVGMMADTENLLHANGNTMDVALEKLSDAVERIGYLYGQPTLMRRPEKN